MSDTFDHQLTAFESQCDSLDDGSTYGNRYGEFSFQPDPLFYHSKINFVKLVSETEKSYLIQLDDVSVQVPKSICRNMSKENKTVFIHCKTFRTILHAHDPCSDFAGMETTT